MIASKSELFAVLRPYNPWWSGPLQILRIPAPLACYWLSRSEHGLMP